MRNARLTIFAVAASLILTCASTPPPPEAFRQLQTALPVTSADVLKDTAQYAQAARPVRFPLPLDSRPRWGEYVNFTETHPVIQYAAPGGRTLSARFRLYQLKVATRDQLVLSTRSWVNHLFASGENTIVIPAIMLIFPDGRQEFPSETSPHKTSLIDLQGSNAFLDREYLIDIPEAGTLNVLLLSYGDYADESFVIDSAKMPPRGPGYIPILFEIGAGLDCLYGSIRYSGATVNRSPVGRVSIGVEWK